MISNLKKKSRQSPPEKKDKSDRAGRSSPPAGGISACIITLNEEARLPSCLKALSFADEIIVLDSGSRDGTKRIAESFGARFIRRRFDGFVAQKNHALSLATRKWVISIDADEVVTPGLRDEILKIIQEPESPERSGFVAYRIPRLSRYLGRWIRHCGWYPEYKTRLFRRGQGSYRGGIVHETLHVSGNVGTLNNHLEHYSYADLSDHLQRIDHYSTLIAQDKFLNRKEKSSITWSILKSISKFLLTYIYHRGFLDGRAGAVISILAGYYNFLKYLKLWELQQGLREFIREDDYTRHPAYRRRI